MRALQEKLGGGDFRSIGRSKEVVADVLAEPELFDPLFSCLLAADPLVRMRAADAVEKITRTRPDLLRPYKRRLLRDVATIDQQEVRWHVAQMLDRLPWTDCEREDTYPLLLTYLDDRSSIVRTCAMQALADLAQRDERFRPRVLPLLEDLLRTGSPAMRSRARKLLTRLRC